ncbi:MAG: putative lipid II flippase FtsW [Candidatus Omnitrophica bacterium]|nr:putative lipid II flippase FtsW [Candidatus Omnitrophota bacterium]
MAAPERGLVLVTLGLTALGVVVVYSTTGIYAREHFGDSLYFLRRELVFVLAGFTGLVAARLVGVERLRRLSVPGLFLAVGLLIAVLVFGREVGGAQRWFRLFGMSFQPIEVVKILVVLYFADFLARRQKEIKSFKRTFLPAACILGAVLVLVLAQPDLGSALLLLGIAGSLFFVAGVRVYHLIATVLAFIPAFITLVAVAPYRVRRIAAFLNPWEDPQGTGYQAIQSFVSIASGGATGVGLGRSHQKLFFLPQAHTDFAYSIIGEELGFIGSLGVLVLFVVFIWLGFRLALQARNLYGSLVGIGLMLSIGLEAVIHMAVAVGAMPTKGMPLPFISYGGSALVFHLTGVGAVLSLAQRKGIFK